MGFDQHIIGAADQHQMLDIIAPDQHQLAILIEIKNIDGTKPLLATAATGHLDPATKQAARSEKAR